MDAKELQDRTKKFAVDIINLVKLLPNNRVGWIFTDQIIRSATSVAANYRAVSRAKSDKDFIYKIGVVIEETDETLFWLEMIKEVKLLEINLEFKRLMSEANELISIFVATSRTIKKRVNQKSKM